MAPIRELSYEQRVKVVTLHGEGKSMRQIGNQLNISCSTVCKTIKRYTETGSHVNRKGRGTVSKLNEKDVKYLCLSSLRNRRKGSKELASDLFKATGKDVTPRLVRYKLSDYGLKGRVAARKPFFRNANAKKRYSWCKNKKQWITADWNHVLFTDESKFELFGCNRRQYVRRRKGERYQPQCLVPTVKHGGGSLQVWGCLSSSGVGDLVKINGIMTAEEYKQILIHHAIPSGIRLIGRGFYLQQDNDPKHSARSTKSYIARKEAEGAFELLDWPSQSPDLNIIEAVWEYMDREKAKRQPSNIDELWDSLRDIWNHIPQLYIDNLFKSMTKRINAVHTAKGYHCKY